MHPATLPSPYSESASAVEPAAAENQANLSAPSSSSVFAVGDYLVGDADDEMLSGHPDIRY